MHVSVCVCMHVCGVCEYVTAKKVILEEGGVLVVLVMFAM